MLRAIYGVMVALVCVTLSSAQKSTEFTSFPTRPATSHTRPFLENEPHLQSEALGALYANSAFAHGYRHGYEEGFHLGDLDIHMGHDGRAIENTKAYAAGRHYHESFGNKALFEQGYDAGIRSGYADAISGSEFRATERAKMASIGLTEVLPKTRRAMFDDGFAAGYRSAQSQHGPIAHMSSEYVEQYCRRTFTSLSSLEYCSGFGHGFVLGTFDIPATPERIATSRTPAR